MTYCDAENVNGEQFTTGTYTFGNGKTQNSKESHSGKYSSYLNKDQLYGMSYRYPDPKAGAKYRATIWVKTEYKNNIKLSIKTPDNKIAVESAEVIKKEDNGWSQIQVTLILPEGVNYKELLVFPYVNSPVADAYFDDLVFYEESSETQFSGLDQSLHLYLDSRAIDKINNKRSEALNKGLLQSSDDDWVKAKMTVDDSLKHDVKLRLKGDWTDHLKGDYWSYRVKMPSDHSWNRLQTFSLQDPATRDYLNEWLYHQVLTDEDIITPRYGFVKLSQNEKEPVLYAYEEHFEKQIAEYRNRREGVILKFGEDAFWAERERNLSSKKINHFKGSIEASEVQLFKEGKTLKSPKLREQFEHGAALLSGYQFQSLPVSEIFDIDRMAKLYALAEILQAYHGLIWHNQRFYYNPVIKKLEPIGFDGYTESGPFIIYNKLFFGEFKTGPGVAAYYAHYQYLFKDRFFNESYIKYLKLYSSENYISQIKENHFDELEELQFLINKSHPTYAYDKSALAKRAKKIRKNIIPYDEHSIVAYRRDSDQSTENVAISNRHPLPLEIVGTGTTADVIDTPIADKLIYSGPSKGIPVYESIEIPDGHKYIYYRLPSDSEVYKSKIKPYSNPLDRKLATAATDISIPLKDSEYKLKNKTLTLLTGNYNIDKPLILPKGYDLEIMPGTRLDMVNKAYLLCYGNVNIMGSKDSPVHIISSDNSSQGFVVLGDQTTATLNNVTFTNLGALEEGSWQLTGAVTLYESTVKMDRVTISNNNCEDALNLVRSKFDINSLNINKTYADGFDGDFCKGEIRNSYFYNTGNDGLDFSGSYVNIKNVTMQNIGDKGISAGEEATLIVSKTTVDGAQIGLASKDLSKVTVHSLSLKNCVQGFAAYRKKPEFGGGTISVKKYEAEAVEKLTIVDSESKISLPN